MSMSWPSVTLLSLLILLHLTQLNRDGNGVTNYTILFSQMQCVKRILPNLWPVGLKYNPNEMQSLSQFCSRFLPKIPFLSLHWNHLTPILRQWCNSPILNLKKWKFNSKRPWIHHSLQLHDLIYHNIAMYRLLYDCLTLAWLQSGGILSSKKNIIITCRSTGHAEHSSVSFIFHHIPAMRHR